MVSSQFPEGQQGSAVRGPLPSPTQTSPAPIIDIYLGPDRLTGGITKHRPALQSQSSAYWVTVSAVVALGAGPFGRRPVGPQWTAVEGARAAVRSAHEAAMSPEQHGALLSLVRLARRWRDSQHDGERRKVGIISQQLAAQVIVDRFLYFFIRFIV